MAAGLQKYPGASTAYFYQNRFGGDVMEVNVVVLHTTEGRSLPDYGGGGSAPNLTAVPDFAARKLRWFQHFDIDRSSRALVNLSGGVETNTLNVVQVELVGTCDPATHRNWGSAEHIYWPEAPDWALAELATFLKWLNTEHDVPLVGPSNWPAYPTSYANGGGQRMTGAQWEAFKGICGHMHVPENVHGDPGAIDFTRLLALAKGQTVPEEDDVPLSDDDATKVAKRVLTIDGIIANPNTDTVSVNPFISLATAVRNTEIVGRRVDKATAALTAQVAALSAAVGKLAEGGGLDASEIQAAAQAGAEAALDRLGDALTKEN